VVVWDGVLVVCVCDLFLFDVHNASRNGLGISRKVGCTALEARDGVSQAARAMNTYRSRFQSSV